MDLKTIQEIVQTSGHNVYRIKHSIRVLKLEADRKVGNCLLFGPEKEKMVLAYADKDHRQKEGGQ